MKIWIFLTQTVDSVDDDVTEQEELRMMCDICDPWYCGDCEGFLNLQVQTFLFV